MCDAPKCRLFVNSVEWPVTSSLGDGYWKRRNMKCRRTARPFQGHQGTSDTESKKLSSSIVSLPSGRRQHDRDCRQGIEVTQRRTLCGLVGEVEVLPGVVTIILSDENSANGSDKIISV